MDFDSLPADVQALAREYVEHEHAYPYRNVSPEGRKIYLRLSSAIRTHRLDADPAAVIRAAESATGISSTRKPLKGTLTRR